MSNWFEDGGQPAAKGWWDGIGETVRGVGGYLQDTLQSPMFLGGAALASGEGFGGMQRGMQAGAQFADQRQKQQQQQAFQKLLSDPNFSNGIDPSIARYAQAAQDPSIIAKLRMPDEQRAAAMHPYDIAYKQAQTAKALREAAEGAGGFGKEIRPYQTADGKIWGVQAGANGDRLMHDLSNPTSPPIYVPRGRHLPSGMTLDGSGGQPAPAGAPGIAPPQAGPLIPPTSGAPVPTRVQHPAPIASAGPSAGMAPSQDQGRPAISGNMGGLFDESRYGDARPAAEEDNFAIMSPSRDGAATLPPQSVPIPGATAAPQAAPQPPAGRQQPTALTPHRGVKQVGKHLVDIGSGRIVGDVEDSLRGGKFVEEDAKAAVADIKTRNDAIQASRSKLPRLEMMAQLIDSPAVYQGTGGNAVLEFKKAAQAVLGMDLEGIPASEAVRMVSNQFALALRNPAGGEGMPGALSDRDLAFLVASTPGLSNTRGGNQIMVRTMIDIEKYKMAENAEAQRYLHKHRSSNGLAEHMQKWAEGRSALSKVTRDMITKATGIQYGVQSGPAAGPTNDGKQQGRLNEPAAGRFSSPDIGGAIPTVRGNDDYQTLPSGSQYYGPDGKLRRKS
ncbi:hypothetical protein [Hyphomicrobium sp. CS1BSMeth3]|uniref:hypothetical protein n=1 Tax=Hyphomicrobium sp. CS1BSMeth3 TaxID=1892844 RepID=UPI0009309838|nr:hypothetical protein [Hyphomicrobium sp. CS1BSMeth3]